MLRGRRALQQAQRTDTTGLRLAGASVAGPSLLVALTAGAVSVGAVAIGALAIGRLAIDRAVVRQFQAGTVEINRLKVAELEIGGRTWPI